MKDTELTQEIVRELLDYNPETGVLTWKERDRKWFKSARNFKIWNTRYSGKEAGHTKTYACGYVSKDMGIQGKNYQVSRVIWLWMTGEHPDGQIDHINRDATDNRWCNLRDVDSVVNGRNLSKKRNNTSGVTGVTWNKRDNRWQTAVRINGERYYLGHYAKDDLESAAKAVEDFRRKHGFSEDHGKDYAHYYKEAK